MFLLKHGEGDQMRWRALHSFVPAGLARYPTLGVIARTNGHLGPLWAKPAAWPSCYYLLRVLLQSTYLAGLADVP